MDDTFGDQTDDMSVTLAELERLDRPPEIRDGVQAPLGVQTDVMAAIPHADVLTELELLDQLLFEMDVENSGTIPPAMAPLQSIAAATPQHKGDGVRAPRETESAQPIAGPSSAPSSGPINQIGGALPQGVPLRIVEERIKQLRRFFYVGRELIIQLGTPESDRDAQTWLEEQIKAFLGRLQDHGSSGGDVSDQSFIHKTAYMSERLYRNGLYLGGRFRSVIYT